MITRIFLTWVCQSQPSRLVRSQRTLLTSTGFLLLPPDNPPISQIALHLGLSFTNKINDNNLLRERTVEMKILCARLTLRVYEKQHY